MRKGFCLLPLVFLILVSSAQRVKIPIHPSRWYQLNNVASNLDRLTDGDTKTVHLGGWNLLVPTTEAYYPLLDGEQMTIDSIRLYDREGIFTAAPCLIYAITGNWERKLLATFTGERYLVWVGPYPSRTNVYTLDTAVSDVRYLMLQTTGTGIPAEMELYGSYTAPAALPATASQTNEPLKRMLGINGFAWNLVDNVNSNIFINEAKLKAVKSFGAFRQYLDWYKSEPVEGRYYFSPQEGGGWPLDTIYQRLLEEDIDVVATIQNLPPWMVATYPDSLQAIDNNPVRYGKSLNLPSSYVELAKLGFQFTARYGRNKNIDSSLVSVYTVPAWHNQKVNSKKIGLGSVKYIECGNEVDKTWMGRKGYLTGREYAANLSAFYDGHLNTLGPGVGVKNADSTMQVVMNGVAMPSTDYFRGIVDWCREFRGYRPDGRINLCFDVINYHFYSTDRGFYQSTSSTRGVAPEKGLADSIARNFIAAANLYAYGLPVWVSEQGYDINQGSPVKAIPVAGRTAAETQADWVLRSGLLYARRGFHRSFFFQVFDLNLSCSNKYCSMGFIEKGTNARRPAADFLYQTIRHFGEYRFQQTLNSDPFVDRYEYNGQSMYAVVVPDEIGRTMAYTLQLGEADSAIVYTPTVGSDSMAQQRVATPGGALSLTATETPVFIVPIATASYANRTKSRTDREKTQSFVPNAAEVPLLHGTQSESTNRVSNSAREVQVYPNPASDKVTVRYPKTTVWRLSLFNMQGQKVREIQATAAQTTLSLDALAAGVYGLQVFDQSNASVHRQLILKQ